MTRKIIFLLWAGLAISCDKEPITLPAPYHPLALKLSYFHRAKMSKNFTQNEIDKSLWSFEHSLNIFVLEKLPPKEADTPEALAEKLEHALETMQRVIKEHSKNLSDSLNSGIFFMTLWDMALSSDIKALKEAPTGDFIDAYTWFWPLQVEHEKRELENSEQLLEFLKFSIESPGLYSKRTPAQMAFAKIRSKIIADELYPNLTEKQMLLLKTNVTAFIQTLDDRQAKLYGELTELQ